MALQRKHKASKMSHGADRKLTSEEFIGLLNDSYKFFEVDVDAAEANAIFKQFAKGGDNLMTYKEYFTFIEMWVCKSKEVLAAPPKPTKDYKSRIRGLFWIILRRLYDKYDKDHNEKLDAKEIEALIREVLGQNSASELEFVLFSIFHMDSSHQSGITFLIFVVNFLRYLADLGLSRWSLQHPHGERKLQVGDFIILFKNTFEVIQGYRVSDRLLRKFFEKIDTNKDGWISFAEYLQWVKYFLCVDTYNFLDFYVEEDDEALAIGAGWISDEVKVVAVPPAPVVSTVVGIECPYKFSNHDLARRLRAHLYALLVQYDVDKSLTFDEAEIIKILRVLLKSDELDIFYVIANVFRYDVDGDRRVTYDEMVNFFLELHAGELAIQRLHKKDSYVRGAERVMSQAEFIFTIRYALGFFSFVTTDDELKLLFSEVDLDHDGWITYREYFEFLRYYFGSLSVVYREKVDKVVPVEPVDPYGKLSPEERFARITIDQLLLLLKLYKLQPFSKGELIRILIELFGLTEIEIEFAINNFFRYDIISGGYFLDTDVARILLEIWFAELVLLRFHRDKKFTRWDDRLISWAEFVILIEFSTVWMKVKHDHGLLQAIFKIIDTNGDGFISYKEYMAFIRKYLGGRIANDDFVDPLADRDPTEEGLYGDIWSELRQIYHHYTKGKCMNAEELKVLVNEVLKEYKQSDMQYIFWNIFRVDPNKDKQIEFEEFVITFFYLGPLHPQARW